MYNSIDNNALLIFDFDDTLVESNAQIIIYRENGDLDKLTSAEFRDAVISPNDIVDFSEFEIYPPGVRETHGMKYLRRALKKFPDNTYVVSARGNKEPILATLEDLGVSLSPSHVYAVGSADPSKKYRVVKNILSGTKFDKVIVFEDNLKNILAIGKLESELGIEFDYIHVK